MPIRAVLAAILAVSCLGINWSATKFALAGLPPYVVLVVRFSLIALILAPFALREARPSMRQMVILSLVLLVAQFTLSYVALTMGLSVTSAVIASQLGVPFACLLSAIFYRDYLGPWRSLGLMVAFIGVMIVAGTPDASEHWGAFALTVVGSFAAAAANLYLKTLRPMPSMVSLLFWPALFAVPVFALLSVVFESGQWHSVTHAHMNHWLGVAYSIVGASFIGHSLWNRLVTTYPISSVVPYSLLIPITGITAGSFAFGDPLTLQVLIGAALTIMGVGIITLRRPQLAEMEG